MTTKEIQLMPIGEIQRSNGSIRVVIDEPYRPAMLGLEHFSHMMVFWWASFFDGLEFRNELQCDPPYAPGHKSGMFATRSPIRPNPLMMTTCTIRSVDQESGIVEVADIDAVDGTPVVDLKAYFPVCDRVRQAHIPEWLSDWPEWMPEDGIGLMEGEEEALVL